MLYHAYEFTQTAIAPWRQAARYGRTLLNDPRNPWQASPPHKAASAMLEIFESATRQYGKPAFGYDTVQVRGAQAKVVEEVVAHKPFCDLIRFRRIGEGVEESQDPKILLVAPMSGHYATLLRGTVETLMTEHDVYITDWLDARDVPLAAGRFDLDDYVDYLREFLGVIGPNVTLMGVCQPGVPSMIAASLMSEDKNPNRPAALVMMGSPIDTRVSPTEPNRLASSKPLSWFKKNVVSWVPWPRAGFMRPVYPGFLQLSSFLAMNPERHSTAYRKQFDNLIRGDGESAAAHNAFYDEYLAVMDLTGEFYLQTIDEVFQRHLLPKGDMKHRGRPVRPEKITDVAFMTIEGGKDDITGAGQTHAALDLCKNLPADLKLAYTHPDVGHYGQFNGGRWRRDIYPKVAAFIREKGRGVQA